MTVEKSVPPKASGPKNECPDVRRRLIQSGVILEQNYSWMVFGQISPRRDGDCNVLLVAPHGFPGDDDNTEILTCLLAEKDGLNCFAVVNNRKYNRKTNSEKCEFWQDLNDKDQAPSCLDFWTPLKELTEFIIQGYAKPPLILFLHGIGNDNADEYLGPDGDFALGAGYVGPYNPDIATASETLVTKLRDALTKRFGLAKDGVEGYGATGRVPVLFKEKFPNQRIEAIQLEIRCRGYRDSIENIHKLVNGLKEILTDTGDEGFQDYFTREHKAVYGITIDPELQSLIPPLSEGEYKQLEENILRAGGCHDPLRVWPHEGKRILLDGHHRSEICRKHGLPDPAIVEIELGSQAEAIQWIVEHQLGRRNLKPFQRIELACRMEPAIRELARARQKDAHKLRGKAAETKDEGSLHSDEMLGNIAGVSARTYRKARDIMAHGSEDLVQRCRDGEIKIDAAFNQIEKLRKERTVKKLAAPPTSAARGESEVPDEPLTNPSTVPLLLTDNQAVPQTDEPASVPDLPSPCDVIIVNVPWELPSATAEKLAAIPIREVAQDNCIVWVRATNSRIQEAYSLLHGWGFEPKTLFTWIKQEFEPAEWLNDRSEHFVVGIKGNPSVNEERKFSTALETSAAKDNPAKAMQFYRLIEQYCSGKTRLEVFSEIPRDGWIPWNPWPVDRLAGGIMKDKVSPATGDQSSKKKTQKSSKKEGKGQATQTKKKNPTEIE